MKKRKRRPAPAPPVKRFSPDISKCSVILESAEHRHHKGNRYEVRIRLTRAASWTSATPSRVTLSHQYANVTIRAAFKAMRRKLQDFHRKQHGKMKRHEEPPHGRVRYIDTEVGYGVIQTPDGRDVHFHPNSLVDAAFDRIRPADAVRFAEIRGVTYRRRPLLGANKTWRGVAAVAAGCAIVLDLQGEWLHRYSARPPAGRPAG